MTEPVKDAGEASKEPAEGATAVVTEFQEELRALINAHSMEQKSGTPDFLLAQFLDAQLTLFGDIVWQRARWRGETTQMPALGDQPELSP